jgi:hypothetical protein
MQREAAGLQEREEVTTCTKMRARFGAVSALQRDPAIGATPGAIANTPEAGAAVAGCAVFKQ